MPGGRLVQLRTYVSQYKRCGRCKCSTNTLKVSCLMNRRKNTAIMCEMAWIEGKHPSQRCEMHGERVIKGSCETQGRVEAESKVCVR